LSKIGNFIIIITKVFRLENLDIYEA